MTVSDRQELLRRRLADAGLLDSPDSISAQRVRAVGGDGPTPLSSAQRRLWYHHQLSGDSGVYNYCLVLRPRDPRVAPTGDALTAAVTAAAVRHEVLRTTYHADDTGAPYQVVRDDLAPDVAEQELALGTDAGAAEVDEAVDEVARAVRDEPFDLARDPGLRVRLLRAGETGDGLVAAVLVVPHIAGDGGSFGTFLAALVAEPDGPSDGAARLRYGDFARWEAEWLGDPDDPSPRAQAQLAFWERALAGAPPETNLPVDRLRPAVPTGRGAHRRIRFGRALSDALDRLASSHAVSPLVLLQAAVATALGMAGGGDDVCLGTPVDVRQDTALDEVVGFFTNTVVLRCRLDGDPRFAELVDRIRDTGLAALDHRDVPFEQVVERLNPPRVPGRNPLFGVMVAPGRGWPDLAIDGAAMSVAEPRQTQAKFDLTFVAHEFGPDDPVDPDDPVEPGRLGVSLLHAADLFDPTTAARLLESVIGVLAQVAHAPDLRLSRLSAFTRPAGSAASAATDATDATDAQPDPVRNAVDELLADPVSPSRPAGARTGRIVALSTDVAREDVAAALYRVLARHDALRRRRDARDGRLRPAGVSTVLDRPVLDPPYPDPEGLVARLDRDPTSGTLLHLDAPADRLDEESWRVLLADLGLTDRPRGTRLGAPSDEEYRRHTAALAAGLEIVDHTDAWLDLLDTAEAAGRPEGPPGTGDGERTVAVDVDPERAMPDTPAWRTAVLTALRAVLPGPVLVELDEPDRDRLLDGDAVVGFCRRRLPVLLTPRRPEDPDDGSPEVPTGDRAAAFGVARHASPHTVGALDDVPVPALRLVLTVTDGGDAPAERPAGPDHDWWAGLEVGPTGLRAVLRGPGAGSPALVDRWAEALRASLEVPDPPAAPATAAAPELVTVSALDRERLADAFGPLREILPLSPLQEGLHFHLATAGEGEDVYVSQTVVELAGPIDPERMRRAADEVVALCPTVAAGFTEVGGRPVQVVPREVRPTWRAVDLTDAGVETEVRARGVADEEYHSRFDPRRPPMVRFALISLSDAEHRLLFTAHHILVDGWSIRLLLTLLLRRYTDPASALAPPPFREYLAWLASRDATAAEAEWAALLAGARPTVVAPRAQGVPATVTDSAEIESTVPAAAAVELEELARAGATTLSTVLELAWGAVLMRLTGSSDVVFGTVVSGRPPELDDVDRMVGLLFNTVPLRVRARPGTTVRAALQHLHEAKSVPLRHPWPSLARLQQLAGGPALFDTLFVVQNLPVLSDDERFGPDGALRRTGASIRDATHYPLSLALTPQPGAGIALRLMYRTDAVDDATAQAVLEVYQETLAALAADPDRALARVDVLAGAGAKPLRAPAVDGRALTVGEESVADLLDVRAAAAPDDRAVVAGEVAMSFAELNDGAHRLARLLVEAGVGAEHRVALLLPRSEVMIVALFGVFAAHAAYVPVDPETPTARIERMLALADPTVVLTTGDLAGRLPDPADPRVVRLDDPAVRRRLTDAPPGRPAVARPAGLDHLAYVIFTSGSTGEPKGVAVDYRGLSNMYRNHLDEIFAPVLASQGGRRLRIAHTTSFSFDASWEQLLWLLAGHEVHVVDDDLRRDPERLLALFDAEGVDAFDVTPTYGQYLVDHGLLDRPRSRGEDGATGLVFVSLGGEAVGESLWTRLRDAPGVGGYNLYGPTEYTINALGADVADHPTPSVGRPIANTSARVLDAGLLAAPVGTAGELYLAGVGLARGYTARSAGTAERFVADPYGPSGARMYRTGDLARWRADGGLDFLGRADAQLKIRGHRVEPGEIENALVAHPDVARAAVVGRESDAGTVLAAYLVPAAGVPDAPAVREHLTRLVPPHMVPSTLTVVDDLPRTLNGKLDVTALPDPDPAPARAVSPPRDARERAVCDAFAAVLELDSVGRDDDFFALGGHSLLTVRLVGSLREALGPEVTVRGVYDTPTPAGLAASGVGGIAAVADTPSDADPEIARMRADAVLPDDVRPLGTPRTGHRPASPRTVLLTGASGFLGGFVLAELLDRTDAEILCVVRAPDAEAAQRRVRATLDGVELLAARATAVDARVVALPGDLARPRLGLEDDAWRRAGEVDLIVHNGGATNDVDPYASLAPTNVGGAVEILRLASGRPQGTAPVPTHMVSTLSTAVRRVDNPDVIAEDTRLDAAEVAANGYVRSKWVAEELAHAAAARGVPVTVHRPGRVSGDSRTGAASHGIGFWMFIRAMVSLGAAPALRSDTLTLAPVDFVAAAVVELAGRGDTAGRIYHLSGEGTTSIAAIVEVLRDMGFALPETGFDEWRARLERLAPERAAAGDDSLAEAILLAEHYDKYAGDVRESTVGRENVLADLADTGVACPPISPAILRRYVERFVTTGFLPPPPSRR